MYPELICQSCTMPIDNMADRGTEMDGSKSTEYCRYCYKGGNMVEPEMTLDQMKELVEKQMRKIKLPEGIIHQSLKALPHLKRWQKVHA